MFVMGDGVTAGVEASVEVGIEVDSEFPVTSMLSEGTASSGSIPAAFSAEKRAGVAHCG